MVKKLFSSRNTTYLNQLIKVWGQRIVNKPANQIMYNFNINIFFKNPYKNTLKKIVVTFEKKVDVLA